MVLLMSVNPGFGGQSFIPYVMEKIKRVRAMIDASGRDVRLEIDGGVTVDNIGSIAAAGVDTFVSGSAIFGTDDYAATIAKMRENIDEGRITPGLSEFWQRLRHNVRATLGNRKSDIGAKTRQVLAVCALMPAVPIKDPGLRSQPIRDGTGLDSTCLAIAPEHGSTCHIPVAMCWIGLDRASCPIVPNPSV